MDIKSTLFIFPLAALTSVCAFADPASDAPGKRVLFLGDSITDKNHIGCTKNYWGFLAERYGFEPLVYGVNGQQWIHIPRQAMAYHSGHGKSPDVVFVFAGTSETVYHCPRGTLPLKSFVPANTKTTSGLLPCPE